MKTGFDMKKYLALQIEDINKRLNQFGEKLYLEVGGKLFDDLHASRVLPGFVPDGKVTLLEKLKSKLEIIFCISSRDIASNKKRGDNELPYSTDVLRLIDRLRKRDLVVSSIVITLFEEQPEAIKFKNMLESRGEKVFVHTKTKGYPTDIDTIVSDEGYGKNPYIPTTKPLVVVTAPGPCSGKLGTCLSQLFHENKIGIKAGYSKLETFPVWNLPLDHPVNVAYEAATLDLNDKNMIDPFHFYAYGKTAINYNRDVEIFPVLRRIFSKISGNGNVFKSPTEMGVNNVGLAISNDDVCRFAARQEILRRYLNNVFENSMGEVSDEIVQKSKTLTIDVGVSEIDRKVIKAAREKYKETGMPAVALELPNGEVVVGRETDEITAASSALMNAIKQLAKIDDSIKLVDAERIKDIVKLKKETLDESLTKLELRDVLFILSITKADKTVDLALSKLPLLFGVEAHSSCVLSNLDRKTMKKLGFDLTSDAVYSSKALYLN